MGCELHLCGQAIADSELKFLGTDPLEALRGEGGGVVFEMYLPVHHHQIVIRVKG